MRTRLRVISAPLIFSILLVFHPAYSVLQVEDHSRNRKGVIVTLAFGHKDFVGYNKTLVKRNKSILDHLWSPPGTKYGSLMDVIIFHEGNIWVDHQRYIQSETPQMPISFVNISSVFQEFHVVNNPFCPPSILTKLENTPPGYFSMCYFWFVAFRKYVTGYDWMLRLDEDCTLAEDSRVAIYGLPETVHFASTQWTNLERTNKFDKITAKYEGMVVRGLRNLTITFAQKHNIFDTVNSWKAPYTNVMYVNLRWLRNNTIIDAYTKAVIDTDCIYGNRWGDLPLWGAAILVAKEATTRLRLPYYHGSHNVFVK
jgi:hypothetical protein